MTAATLVAALHRRGVRLEARGDRLQFSPASALTEADLAALRQLKTDVLHLLAADRPPVPTSACGLCGSSVWRWASAWPTPADPGRWLCGTCTPPRGIATAFASLTPAERAVAVEAAGGGPLARLVTDAVLCTPEPCAWRLHSSRLDRELWLARDAEAAAQLDTHGARDSLPVVLADDLQRLRAFDDKRLRDLLEVPAIFPGARLAQLDPEAAS